MNRLERLAFVDLETTGLSPSRDRITEIGVVTVDSAGVSEWTALINPATRISRHSRLYNGIADDTVRSAPRFRDIAADLSTRLAGRLFIAHNARFDFSFLKAEFERIGMPFEPQVLCSVMLSRKLYAQFARHDLDSLMERHTLGAGTRHRALPDAQLLWQFWQRISAQHPRPRLLAAVEALLAGPVLPAHLDSSLVERLPEAPGVYVLHADDEAILHAGKAGNLKLHLLNYFRIDRASRKALEVSHLVKNITWRVTRGAIGAHLQLKALAGAVPSAPGKRAGTREYTWRLDPGAYPSVELIRMPDSCGDGECYGRYASELKARNALLRVAGNANLCHALLGMCETPAMTCTGCDDSHRSFCGNQASRMRQLTKAVVALAPLRVTSWPYEGPIGVRERSDLHIIDEWRYLGTARSEQDIHQILECRPNDFDENTYAYLAKTLSRLPQKRIVRLAGPDRRRDEQSSPSQE